MREGIFTYSKYEVHSLFFKIIPGFTKTMLHTSLYTPYNIIRILNVKL